MAFRYLLDDIEAPKIGTFDFMIGSSTFFSSTIENVALPRLYVLGEPLLIVPTQNFCCIVNTDFEGGGVLTVTLNGEIL